jgi:hypothetical protein
MQTQPLHQMALVLFVLSFVAVAGLLLIARLVNLAAKRALLNGGYAALALLLVLMAALLGLSLFHPQITPQGSRILGQAMASLLPASLLAFFLGRGFQRRHKLAAPSPSAPSHLKS